MLTVHDVVDLVGYTYCFANHGLNVSMRVPVYPELWTAMPNEVGQFHREGSVDLASFERAKGDRSFLPLRRCFVGDVLRKQQQNDIFAVISSNTLSKKVLQKT